MELAMQALSFLYHTAVFTGSHPVMLDGFFSQEKKLSIRTFGAFHLGFRTDSLGPFVLAVRAIAFFSASLAGP